MFDDVGATVRIMVAAVTSPGGSVEMTSFTRCRKCKRSPMTAVGRSIPNEVIDFESALTSTPDISLHRTNRRCGGP